MIEAWSKEKKYMRRYKGKYDIFFGIEHRWRQEEMKEQFSRETKEGWGLAADAARITNEMASSEERKHTSGGVCVAVDSYLGAVVGAEEGAILFDLRQRKMNRPGMGERQRRFASFLCVFQGWTPRNEALLEAVLKQASTTRHLWLVACDANMCPEDFEKKKRSLVLKGIDACSGSKRRVHVQIQRFERRMD